MDCQPDVRIGAIECTLQGVGNAVVALVAQHPDELGDEHVTHLDTPKPHAATKDTRSGRGERNGAMRGYALTSDGLEGNARAPRRLPRRPTRLPRRRASSAMRNVDDGALELLDHAFVGRGAPGIAASTSAALSRSPLPFAS